MVVLSLALAACGTDGFSPKAMNGAVEKTENKYNDYEVQAEETLQKVDALVFEIENDETLSDIEQNTSLSLFKIGKIKDLLKNGLKPLLGKIGDIKTKIDDLKLQIEQQISLLDPNDPQQKRLIEQLERVLDRIAKFEGKIDQAIDKLIAKIDIVDQLIDKLLQKLDGSLWQIPVQIALDELKEYVKDQLRDYLRDQIGIS